MRDKPFPWTCGHCATKTVFPELVGHLPMKILIKGTVETIHVYNIEIPTCIKCKTRWFGIKEDEIIQAAKEEFIKTKKSA
jgi:hypothetical protein